MVFSALVFTVSLLISGPVAGSPPAQPADPATTSKDTQAWRDKREQDLRGPDGWLAVAGLFFLKPGQNSVGSKADRDILLPTGGAPEDVGTLTYVGGRVWFDAKPGVSARLNDVPVTSRIELRLADAATKRPADRLAVGRVNVHLHLSGERLGVRLRDPESPIRTGFTGVEWFPIDPAWRVTGRFATFTTPKMVPIQNVLGDIEPSRSSGEVDVVLNGTPVRLLAVDAGARLWFIFRDASAAQNLTYRIRFLYADAPNDKGEVVLDFNRAYNPPCAYNPHTTCPLPPAQNRLAVSIPAGEKRYAPGQASSAPSEAAPSPGRR